MTDFNRRQVLAGAGLAGTTLIGVPRRSHAQVQVIRVGVLADFSGPYRSTSGPTSLAAAQQAVEDLGMAQRGIRVEVLQGDHQNRQDAALALARRWIDQDGVDMLCEVNNSAIALAVANLVREKDRIQLCSGAATSALTGAQCSTHTIHWTYDTWMFANLVGGRRCARVATAGTSSRPTTPSGTSSNATPAASCSARAGGCWARRAIPSPARRISRPSYCRRRHPARRWWASRWRRGTW
jgi:hypothetical protein